MDSRRLEILRALDIDVWQRRDRVPAAVEESAPAAVMRAVVSPPKVTPLVSPEPVRTRPVEVAPDIVVPERPPQVLPDVSGMDWDALSHTVRECTLCDLYKTRTQAVFGVGNRKAQWMVIGEAPGAEEDARGEPFVGRAGQLLNSMLRAIGLAREDVFIANILKSRPPSNRDPRPEEVRVCLPYLYRQIELVNPRLILCVGRIAAQNLLNTTETIGKLRGRLHQIAAARPMIVTYHPAYLLRSPAEKRKSWADLVLAMQTFERLGG
ncbi:MAG: uracil-DNA glycosylase [Steroidobacteraceae bacterium]